MLQNFSNSEVLTDSPWRSSAKRPKKNPGKEVKASQETNKGLLGKRKRKTERELTILRRELTKNVMWTRESIQKMRAKYDSDFSMTEQQIYKWWWDQTRKRAKHDGSEGEDEDCINLISFQDEFGGYSSRLRHSGYKKGKKEEELEEQAADGDGLEVNLCELLGIDVEAIAMQLAMEEADETASRPLDANLADHSDIYHHQTATSLQENLDCSPNGKGSSISDLLQGNLNDAETKTLKATRTSKFCTSNKKSCGTTHYSSRRLSAITDNQT